MEMNKDIIEGKEEQLSQPKVFGGGGWRLETFVGTLSSQENFCQTNDFA